jgi:hypothetical protein
VVTSKSSQWWIDSPLEPFTKLVGMANVYCTAGVQSAFETICKQVTGENAKTTTPIITING